MRTGQGPIIPELLDSPVPLEGGADLWSVWTSMPHAGTFVYVNAAGEVWRVSFPRGAEQRFKGPFPNLSPDAVLDLHLTRDELVSVAPRLSARLVLVENLFE